MLCYTAHHALHIVLPPHHRSCVCSLSDITGLKNRARTLCLVSMGHYAWAWTVAPRERRRRGKVGLEQMNGARAGHRELRARHGILETHAQMQLVQDLGMMMRS